MLAICWKLAASIIDSGKGCESVVITKEVPGAGFNTGPLLDFIW